MVYSVDRLYTQRNWSGNLIGTSGLGQSYKCTGKSDKVLEINPSETLENSYRTIKSCCLIFKFLIKAFLMPVTLLFEIWPKSSSAATFSSFNYSNQSYMFCVRKPCQNQYVSFHLKRKIINMKLILLLCSLWKFSLVEASEKRST